MAGASFALGVLVGALVVVLVLALVLRLAVRPAEQIAAPPPTGLPDVAITLSRDALNRMIDDALQDVAIPLVSLRDPQLALEPDAVLLLRMRGDTALLGAQPIVLRMRVVPAADGVAVRTERAEVGGGINIAGGLTARLDERINADLRQRLPLTQQLDVVTVGGTAEAITIEAQLRSSAP